MSWYTVGEIWIWLLLALLLGIVIGWLLHVLLGRRGAARVAELEAELAECRGEPAPAVATPEPTPEPEPAPTPVTPEPEPEPASVDEARSRVAAIAERTAAGHAVATDDLKLVHGIGPKISSLLISMGITSFEQIARFTDADIAVVSKALETFPDRVRRDDWMVSARRLHQEHHGEDPLA